MLISVGADPEMFLYNPETLKLKSAIGLFGGTKEQPLLLYENDPHSAVQEDNVAVEFNIPPCTSANMFINNIQKVQTTIEAIAKMKGYKVSNKASGYFSKEDLEHPKARVFGCDPDYNAWNLTENEKPVLTGRRKALRTAGGHVHVAFENVDIDSSITLVKVMDIFLGLNSVVEDKDTRRRVLYGKSGAFRPKPYGVEYRVLSNYWIFNSWMTHMVYQNTDLSVQVLDHMRQYSSSPWHEYMEKFGADIQEAIDTSDRGKAKALLHQATILKSRTGISYKG